MATVLRIKYVTERKDISLTEQAREILEMRGSNDVVTVNNPELLLEIERVNRGEVECKLHVEYAEEKSSYGYSLNEELRDLLNQTSQEEDKFDNGGASDQNTYQHKTYLENGCEFAILIYPASQQRVLWKHTHQTETTRIVTSITADYDHGVINSLELDFWTKVLKEHEWIPLNISFRYKIDETGKFQAGPADLGRFNGNMKGLIQYNAELPVFLELYKTLVPTGQSVVIQFPVPGKGNSQPYIEVPLDLRQYIPSPIDTDQDS